MTSLLDVSTLLALLVEGHEFNQRANTWLTGRRIALCPISELGFLRVASQAYGLELRDAREALQQFKADHQPEFLPCDISALDGTLAPTAGKTTDYYLANLAEKHGLKWATLDERVNHPAAILIR